MAPRRIVLQIVFDFSFTFSWINQKVLKYYRSSPLPPLPRSLYSCLMEELIKLLTQFRDEREWKQFHNPKDLALALNIEAAELLEVFLWKRPEDAPIEKVKEELADVFAYAFLMAEVYGLDVDEIVREKVKKNSLKYPVDKAKGNAKKYDEL